MTVEVLDRDDRLLLHNTSGQDVMIEGYSGEPYARIDADGTVSVNTDSEAYYINEERDGKVEVPPNADSEGEPRWEQVSRGEVVRWIGPEDSDEPAPTLTLAASPDAPVSSGAQEPAAEAGTAPAAATTDDDGGNGLAIVAVIFGALRLAAGVAAWSLGGGRGRQRGPALASPISRSL